MNVVGIVVNVVGLIVGIALIEAGYAARVPWRFRVALAIVVISSIGLGAALIPIPLIGSPA